MKAETFLTLEKIEMKKTLVALAAVSAVTAFAQSTVTVTGIMDAGYQSGKLYGQSFGLVQQNGARTSAIKFIGTEDLGGGLTAKFQFEVDPSVVANDKNLMNNSPVGGQALTTTAATTSTANYAVNGGTSATPTGTANNAAAAQPGLTGAGYSYVGLAGGFGEVQFGTLNTHTLDAFGTAAGMFGTAVGGGYGSGLYGKYTRYENSMLYISPDFNGFKVRYLSAPGNNQAYGSKVSGITLRRPDINELGLNYAQGPLTVRAAQITSKATTNEADATGDTAYKNGVTTTIKTIAAAYDFGMAKVGYGLQTVLADGSASPSNTDTKAQSVYVQVPVNGVTRVQFNTGSLTSHNLVGSTAYLLAGGKNTFTSVGVQYDLSKRSFAYLTYERATMGAVDFAGTIVQGTTGSTTTSQQRNVTAVGISHSF